MRGSIRCADGDVTAKRTVAISLLSEDMTNVVLTGRLLRAWPVKYSCGDLNAKGTDVAMEELEESLSVL